MKKTLGEKAIANRLNKYFSENYSEYNDTVEWYVNPNENQWKGDIKELNLSIVLTCDVVTGKVSETRTNLKFQLEQ